MPDRLAQLATTDPLTGLLNARAFHEQFRHELGRAARYQEPLSFLIVDVDRLKHVNDQYGHASGDAALQSVAAVIRSGLRQIDFGARLGGDEFGMLAPRTSLESAIVLAERLRALLAERRGTRPGTTISIGIASLVPSTGEQPAMFSLMATADNALYQAKRAGGNRAVAAP
jgi:diguanylate cyclase (GGDEF)-like protein